MQEDTHVCVSEPHKKQKKNHYLLEIDPVMTPVSKWEWHMPLNGVFLNIQVVLSKISTFMFMQNQDLKCNCAIL